MNLIMEEIYRVMFQSKMPRFFPKMEEILQFARDIKVGDWFLLKEHTIIRLYGFTHEPYILSTFLTLRIIFLEFIKKKLIVENQHFINSRKDYEIKLPLKVGPFIIKYKFGFPMIEGILQDMNFMKSTKVNYDPHHIISQRRKHNKMKNFNVGKQKDQLKGIILCIISQMWRMQKIYM